MDESHFVDGVEGENHLGAVELCPLLGDVVVAHEVDQVTTGHVVHHHVQVPRVLEGVVQLEGRENLRVDVEAFKWLEMVDQLVNMRLVGWRIG